MLRRLLVPLGLAAWLALLLWVRLGDPFGDRGMSNVISALLVLLLALVVLLRFMLSSRRSARLRLGVLAALALGLVLGAVLVRYEGVSGVMVPALAWRWSAVAEPVPIVPIVPILLGADGADGMPRLGPPSGDDFPAFLGARGDNSVRGITLARDWQGRPPRELWRVPIGAGWAAFALQGGWAFTLEQAGGAQRASARLQETGALLWSTEIEDSFEHVLGGDGPRSTPALDEGRLYALGSYGRFVCLDASDGALLWEHDLSREHGMDRALEQELLQYGRSNSPLVAGELVIVPAGGAPGAGQAGLVAFDKRTGEQRWASPPRQVSYASPALATLAGFEQVLIVNEDTLSGHALDDGRLLWEHPWPGVTNANASVSQALPIAPDRVFVSKGYGGGALLLELVSEGGALVPRELWSNGRILRTKLTNVALHAGHVYGLDDGILECVELASGRRLWKDGRHGHGQVLLVGELLLLVSEEGEVFLIDPSPERENEVLGSFQGLNGKSWAHLAFSRGVLFLRNAEEATAWELPLR